MTENVENLIIEHLRAIRGDVGGLAQKMESLIIRVGSMEEPVAGLRRDLALLHGDIAATNQRLDQQKKDSIASKNGLSLLVEPAA